MSGREAGSTTSSHRKPGTKINAHLPVDLIVGRIGDTEIGAGLGHVHLVLLHRRVVRVVTVVGAAPGEVGSPHEGVRDEADDVADSSVGRESTMTGLEDIPNGDERRCDKMLNRMQKCAPHGQ